MRFAGIYLYRNQLAACPVGGRTKEFLFYLHFTGAKRIVAAASGLGSVLRFTF